MPGAEHRNCLKHIYENFKKKFKGQELKELLWKAASTTNLREHELWMKTITAVDINAHNWLAAIVPHLWTRSHFSHRSKYDILVNNICESFNAYILEAKEKQIISMIESIRRSLMNRIQVKRNGMEKYNGVICPKNLAKLERIKDNARNCFAHWAGNMKFEVDNFDKTYVVDLGAKTCGCKMWELSEILCKHAIAAINFNRKELADYVDKCYRKDLCLATYNYMINPVPGIPLLTPIKRGQVGRPKKMWRRGPDEPRVALQTTRMGKSIQCKRCLQKGHNQRSCKNSKYPKSKLVEKENS